MLQAYVFLFLLERKNLSRALQINPKKDWEETRDHCYKAFS